MCLGRHFVLFIGLLIVTLFPERQVVAQTNSDVGKRNDVTCRTGFRYILKTNRCVDIDECEEKRFCKGYQARCLNSPGSYRCACWTKMQGNGIDACGYVIPFHQTVEYPDFSSITEETIVDYPPPAFIKRRQNQLKISMNLQAGPGRNIISKIKIKTVTPIHPTRPKYNITYDVYLKTKNFTPLEFTRLLVKTKRTVDLSDKWKFGDSNPTPERLKCSPSVIGYGRERIRFGKSKAPSEASSIDMCPGTNISLATIMCRRRTHKDGGRTAFYGHRSIVMRNCSAMKMDSLERNIAPQTTNSIPTENSETEDNTTTVSATKISTTTPELTTATDSTIGTSMNNTTAVTLTETNAWEEIISMSASSTILQTKAYESKDEITDAIELISSGYNASGRHGIDIDAMIRKFVKSLSDPTFRAKEEAFVRGKEIMNIIFDFMNQSETFELSTSSMAGSVSILNLLVENPAKVITTEKENLYLAMSFEKLSTRLKLEGDEVFSVDSKFLSLKVEKMNVGGSGSGDGNSSQLNGNKYGMETTFPSASAYLPSEAMRIASDRSSVEEPKAAFTLFKNASLFPTNTDNKEDVEISQVLSVSAGGIGVDNLSQKFWYQMPIETNRSEGKSRHYLKCAFLDEVTKTWSTIGCKFVPESNPPKCSCNHLTNFALIVKSVNLPEQFALDIVGKVGCSISIAGLVWMLGCYFSSRSLLKNRINQIHINLGLSLLAAYILFLAGVESTDTRSGCIAVAAMLHFLLLSSWGWMTVECITMYRKLVSVLSHTGSTYLWTSVGVVYGGSIVIVSVTIGVTIGWYDKRHFVDWNPEPNADHAFKTLYVSERLCWLQGYPLTFGFLVPIAIAFSLNLLAFIRISKAITCDRKKIRSSRVTTTNEEVKDYLIRAVVISFLFGLTWIFAIPLTATDDNTVNLIFSWLFSIFNSLQGFFIFFFFCVRRDDVRKLWMKHFNRITRRYVIRRAKKSESRQSEVVMDTMSSTCGEKAQKSKSSSSRF